MKFVNKHCITLNCYHIFVLTHDSICYVFKYRMIDGVSSFCKCQAVLCPPFFRVADVAKQNFRQMCKYFLQFHIICFWPWNSVCFYAGWLLTPPRLQNHTIFQKCLIFNKLLRFLNEHFTSDDWLEWLFFSLILRSLER